MIDLGEKIAIQGVESLSDEQLLSVLLDEKEGEDSIPKRLVNRCGGNLNSLMSEGLSRLRMCEGLGLRKALRLVAAEEFGKRCAANSLTLRYINSSNDVVSIFSPRLEGLNHEECWVLYLNDSGAVVGEFRASQGGINSTIIDIRLILRRALDLLATRLIVVHNHPIGDSAPSTEDVEMTKSLESAAALFDITVMDHLILSRSAAPFSMRGAGLLEK